MAFPALPGTGAPDALEVTLLAVLQGLTEFLPVSSSGHLVLMESLLEVRGGGLLLPVALHVGTLLAVLLVYRESVASTVRDVLQGRPRYAALLLLGSVPAGLAGVLLEQWFSERFSDTRSAALGLLGTALILVLSDLARRRRATAVHQRGSPRVADALCIGLAQAVAILPGVSRSGSTIGAGLALGLAPAEAARFSFLLSLIAITGAGMLEASVLLRGEDLQAPGVPLLAWGVLVSAVVGWIALRLLLAWGVLVSALVGWAALRMLLALLARGVLLWFAAYCAALGAAFLLLT